MNVPFRLPSPERAKMADPRNLFPVKKQTPLAESSKPGEPSRSGKSDEGKPGAKQDAAANKKSPPAAAKKTSERLASLDAFRGLIMLFMASSGLGLSQVAREIAKENPDTWWRYVASQVEHVPWASFTSVPASLPLWGFSLWDLIQPAFMFMVGVAASYSLASRQARGDNYWFSLLHALWRAVVLVLMGVFLSSVGSRQTNWAFMNVLSQIGLGYLFVFLLVNRPRALQISAIGLLLAGHAYAYVQHPLPAKEDWAKLGLTERYLDDGAAFTGVMAPWSEHINFGGAVDRRFLNLFPRPPYDEQTFQKRHPGDPDPVAVDGKLQYVFNEGGYQTINFVTSLATMLLGLIVGEYLRGPAEPATRLKRLFLWGGALIVAGLALHFTCCPIIKRIWTPSWTLYSGGAVIWILAALYGVIDLAGWRRWAFPLVVVGMNSIAIYLMSQLMRGFTSSSLKTHLRVPYEWFAARLGESWPSTFQALTSSLYYPILERSAILLVFWLICWWMYRQRIFVRV